MEARGIRDAFFPETKKHSTAENNMMLVGSVKTAVGHTEGTAGLAGLIKVANALRRGVIPPNMLFEKLNPKLLPLTSNLRVVTKEQSWPSLLPNQPRRASVNSFGFGGTNAHAILENYEPEQKLTLTPKMMASLPLATPLVFSANSEKSLVSMITQYSAFIQEHHTLCLNDLAWTLQSRRSELPIKAVFSGPSREEVLSNMEAALEKAKDSPPLPIGQRSTARTSKARIFGVFTGQGAQWANMGRDLILASSMAKGTIEYLEACLADLPDGPAWSLMEELTDKDRPSRLDEAELAQPICTAVQVMVVNILQSAGISFAAVVGHSSGEITAAYAAGVITASEAIKIAYYRGFHSKLSKGPGGEPGSMMAAGMSFDEANEFCSQPAIGGRVQVAASNAPQSVTLSGDTDAVQLAKGLLEKQKTFVRLLKVNKAYHSRHMQPSSQPYIASLKACGIKPKYPRSDCAWISSVFGDRIEEAASLESLASTYWNDNMLKPVLFSVAIEQAMQNEQAFDLALEVGPHAALKGPALQTIKQVTGNSLTYGATLTRGMNDVAAISGTFGFLMTHTPTSSIKLETYTRSFQSDVQPRLLTGLPTYAWDHSQTFWTESRQSRRYRLRNKPRHDLLGERFPDDLEYDMRWRNTLRVSETPWLAGHKVQGQIVFPAAGYLVMALEASKELAQGQPVNMVELLDVEISRAIPLEDDSSGVDTLLGLRKTSEGALSGDNFIEAEFSCFSCVGEQAENWDLNARGRLRVILGEFTSSQLPMRDTTPILLNPLSTDTFYGALKVIGFDYQGLFRRLDTIERRMNRATSTATEYPEDKYMSAMIHPALLDAAFQSLFAALHYPEDGTMNAPLVPTYIKCIRFPAGKQSSEKCQVAIESFITVNEGSQIIGDIDMYHAETGEPRIQVEGLACTSLDRPRAANDNELYAQTVLKADVSAGIPSVSMKPHELLAELDIVELAERLSYMYLRKLSAAVSRQEVKGLASHHQRIFEWIDHLFPIIESGQHPTIREEWSSDDSTWLLEQASRHNANVDIRLVNTVGENLLAAIKGETDILKHLTADNMLDDYKESGLGLRAANITLAKAVGQITHRYPRMRILDIGGGNGSTTKTIMEEIGHSFRAYTFTDNSSDSFSTAESVLKTWAKRIKFQALDIEGDISAQGYEEQSYDLIIAANALQATQNLRQKVTNIRSLLKPGGFLLLLDITGDVLRTNFIMSGLPSWWPHDEDGRRHGPGSSVPQWACVLKETGFSGVDHVKNDYTNDAKQTFAVMLSQAVNDEVMFLRNPLSPPALPISLGSLLLIGRNERRRAEINSYLRQSCKLLGRDMPQITYFDRVEDILHQAKPMNSVLLLQDLDEPIWNSLSDDRLRALRRVFDEARQILWVTSGCRLENPFANMSVGMGRGLQAEYSHVKFQLLDVDPKALQTSNVFIAEAAMRLIGHDAIKASCPELLWTLEPELLVEHGQMMIPRVIADPDLNERLNAIRRPIAKSVEPSASPILVDQAQGSYVLSEPRHSIVKVARASDVTVQVTHSLLSTVKIASNVRLYLSLGQVVRAELPGLVGTRVLALSDSLSSVANVPAPLVVPVSASVVSPAQFVQAVATTFLADALLSQLRSGSTILLFEADQALITAFQSRASELGLDMVLASSNPVPKDSKSIYIDPHTPQRKIRNLLPAKVDLFLNFGASVSAVESCLPKKCIITNFHNLVGAEASKEVDSIPDGVHQALTKAQSRAQAFDMTSADSLVTSLSELSSDADIRPFPCVLDFTKDAIASVNVAPIDTKGLFRSDRTYLLVGCTGGLGQSLCRWMVANGAKHLALTSRNPKSVNQIWLDELRAMGGNPRIFATDVVDANLLQKTYEEINREMPPIAGVANAAMVLSDRLFLDITAEDFEKVLKPKVTGTRNLDKLFSGKDLDFFILFSSFASIVGNRGQTNYLAANLYMATIAAQRRARGLPASVMHIGVVLGVGVVFQTGLYESTLKRMNFMPISESSFLDMFAECIVVGRPDSGHSNDFITGLGRLSTRADAQNPFYADNVRFSGHVVIDEEDDTSSGSSEAVPPKQRLAAAASMEERTDIIQEGFLNKLERILQSAKEHMQPSQPLLALGVDSLMAVEIRSWFLNELDVDMPVLKILGGASITELCLEAAKSLPEIIVSAPAAAAPAASAASAPSKPKHASRSSISKPAASKSAAPEPVKSTAPLAPSTPPVKAVRSPLSHHKSPVLTSSQLSTPTENMLTPDLLPMRNDPDTRSTSPLSFVDVAPTPLDEGWSSDQTPRTTPGDTSDEDEAYEPTPRVAQQTGVSTKIKGSAFNFERAGRMSSPQERLWFLQSYLSDPTTYNITMAYKLTGPLRVADMEQAFHTTIQRHEILRTVFFTDTAERQAMQGIIKTTPFKMEQKQMTGDAMIKEEFQKTNDHVYDLEHAETMRATLLSENANSHVLIMGYHHIALDATTALLFVRDFAMIYSGMKLAPLKSQYLDYTSKQRGEIERSLAKDTAYWKAEFPSPPEVLPFFDFGTVKIRKPLTEYKNRILETRLDAAFTSKVKAASQKLQVTAFHVHLATLQVMLHRLLHINDVCIGITDANKNDPEHFDTLGFFVNLLPLRFQVDGNQSFTHLAQKAKDKSFEALAHSQMPFDILLDELKIPRSTTHNPLFQVLMNYKMGSSRTVPLGECEAEAIDFQDVSNPYDLQFDVENAVDGTTLITVTTQHHLYSDADLSTIVQVYCRLLKSLSAKPSVTIADHSLFSRQDVEAALEVGKGPRIDLDQSFTVTGLFDTAVERRSNAVAVVDNVGGCLTWNQMAARVHAMATHLIRVGVKPQSFVAVYCEPTVNSICYWLAILRMGAVYVPLDVSNPAERLRLIVDDCKPSAIICDKHTLNAAQDFQLQNCTLVRLSDLNGHRPHYVRDSSQPTSIACTIYTSGTTGTPKGTLLTNGNLVNHILGVNARFNMIEEVVLQPTNLGFDLSLAQMIQFLGSQGKLVVASYQSRADPLELAKLMLLHSVTYTIVTPSVYSLMLRQGSEVLRQCTAWRSAISCGEALTASVVKDLQSLNLPSLRLINSCGPTEITIVNSAWEIPLKDPNASDHVMMIGSSLPNYSAYILGADGNPLPVGFAGEMVCGGAGISRGYLGKKELTAAKWVKDPFAAAEDQAKGWTRMYRTGDRAKLLPDGQLVFLGRIEGDQQIKLRGVRIELDDIANTIIRHAHGEISEAAISLRGEGDAAFLVGFVALASSATAGKSSDWSKILITGLPLPSSMKPSRLVVLERLPRTPNGKLDRRALNNLPLPSLGEDQAEEDDLTTTESTMKEIWVDCIPSATPTFVRKGTDFFSVGGNSMLLVTVQAQIKEKFGVTVPLFKLFQASTVRNMAAHVDAAASPTIKTAINWDQVTALDRSLFEQAPPSPRSRPISKSGLEILLTGATGFLGSCILQELVADERISIIHCVAIRLANGATSRSLAVDSPKIVKHYGELGAPRLGLSKEMFDKLSRNADRIIHNGADVSFLKAYSTLEKTNMGSTKELARLSAARKIPFHFVSTAGVASFVEGDELPEIFISDRRPPVDGSGGYAASKWASETYLEQCSKQLDIPVWVHRPSNILGAGAENVNMTANVIEYSLRVGATPETPNLRGNMQFVEVEEVGRGLVDSLFSRQDGAQVFHHCSDDKVKMSNLKPYLEKKYNRRLLSLELTAWVKEAKAKGLPQGNATMMTEVLRNADTQAVMKTLSRRSKRLSLALTSWFQEMEGKNF